MESMKLFISIPSNRDWKGRFGASLTGMFNHIMANGVPGYKLENTFLRSYGQASNISVARQKFVDEMLERGDTHWLSLDDDMAFPMDIVTRLASHGKDVVSINARHKTDEIKGSLVGFDDMAIDSTSKQGLEEVKSIGGAIFLAKVDAFRNIPRPHFEVRWVPEKNDYLSEDRYFAELLRLHGVKMYCDHDASRNVVHIGDKEYGWPKIKQGLVLIDKVA